MDASRATFASKIFCLPPPSGLAQTSQTAPPRQSLTRRSQKGQGPGVTTMIRDAKGKKRQIKAPQYQKVTVVERPDLRIVDQAAWKGAQRRLKKIMEIHGMKAGRVKRGPIEYYSDLYPKRTLHGLVYCHLSEPTRMDKWAPHLFEAAVLTCPSFRGSE